MSVSDPCDGRRSDAEATLRAALYATGAWDLTHGVHPYPAGLHPRAARLLLGLVPGPRVLDPFVGGGTVAVEGWRAGRAVVGRDISALALRVSAARCRVLTPDLEAELVSWSAGDAADPSGEAAAFCHAAAEAGGAKGAAVEPASRRIGRAWLAGLRALAAVVPRGTPPPDLAWGDARTLSLDEPVDGVLTSPPYPGALDYLARPGAVCGVDGPGEIGARAAFDLDSEGARAAWLADTLRWTARAAAALRPGGRMVVVIGDGSRPRARVDSLGPTLEAGEAAGLRVVAVATAEAGTRSSPRREHAVLMARPG